PRANPTVATGALGYAYLFGGEDADGNPRGTFWRFDTTATPDGSWFEGADQPELARTGADLAPLGSETYLVTGTPPVLMEGIFGRVTPFDAPASLEGRAASVQTQDGAIFALVVGEGAGATGIVRIAAGDI